MLSRQFHIRKRLFAHHFHFNGIIYSRVIARVFDRTMASKVLFLLFVVAKVDDRNKSTIPLPFFLVKQKQKKKLKYFHVTGNYLTGLDGYKSFFDDLFV
jgi:hypothetical protein